jgi:hypothetical protein
MPDRFHAETWVYWAQLLRCGAFGSFSVIFGILVWTGIMTDSFGDPRPQAGPPMVIVGFCLLPLAALALCNIVGCAAPLIRCYREGIKCNLVGATSVDGVPLLPKEVRIAWAMLSLQGFRSQRVRLPWQQFAGAGVSGIPMAYVLNRNGLVINLKSGQETRWVASWPRRVSWKTPGIVSISSMAAGAGL